MIAILVTGGTFDKQYNELAGTLTFKETHVPEMLRLGRCRVDVAVRQLMMIDSLEMTDADRRSIADACLAFGHIYRRTRGMYITREMKGRIAEVLRNWPARDVRFICVSTGGRRRCRPACTSR